MKIFIDQPTVSEPKKGGRPLLRLNVLFFDENDSERVLFVPGVLIADGLIYMPSYRWGNANIPSVYLAPGYALDLYTAVEKLAPNYPTFFPLQPKELVLQALQPPAQTLIQKFPGYVRARQ